MSIKELFKKHQYKFFLYVFGVLLTTPTNLLVTLSMGNAFRILEEDNVLPIIVLSIVLSLLPALLQLISRYLRVGFMNDVLLDLRLMSYQKVLATPIHEFKKESIENYQSRLTSDINLFESDFFLSILNIGYSMGSYLLGMIVITCISPILSLIVITASLLFFILTKVFEKATKRTVDKLLLQNKLFHQTISNLVRGLETIKLYKVEEYFIKQSRIEVDQLENVKKEKTHVENLQKEVFMFLAFFFQAIAFIVSAVLLSQGKIKMAQLIIVLNLVGQLTWTITNMFAFLNRYKVSIKVYNDLTALNKNEEYSEAFTFNEVLEVKDLTYAYGENEVLSDLNFSLKAGENLLITGPSGTGKSTALELMLGNLSLQSGSIKYDGVDRASIDPKDFWSQVSYARQNHFMFDDSIVNNVILNHPFSSKRFEEIMRALDLYDWIESLEAKENSILENNASNISGGQRQRLSLARALYQESKLYVFDEASASLDDETAFKVYSYLNQLDASVILVSHRHLDYLEDFYDLRIDLVARGDFS